MRLLMNGESPMMSPVSGLRSGAPDGSVSSSDDGEHAEQRVERPAQPLRLGRRVDLRALLALELLGVGLGRGSTRPGAAR